MIQRGPRHADTLALINTEALADGRLSFKARGILAYLLANKPGFAVSVESLAKHGTDGKRAVESGLKELEDAGYLTRSTTLDGTPLLTATDTPGVEAPTRPVHHPAPQVEVVRPADAPAGWRPSEQAVKTAKDNVDIVDIELFITHYRIRCSERGTTPSSAEWLRWLIEDEKKERIRQKEQARENGAHRPWFAVAGD